MGCFSSYKCDVLFAEVVSLDRMMRMRQHDHIRLELPMAVSDKPFLLNAPRRAHRKRDPGCMRES